MNTFLRTMLLGCMALVSMSAQAGSAAALKVIAKVAVKPLPLFVGAGIGIAGYKNYAAIRKKIADDNKAFKEWVVKPHVWAGSLTLAGLTGWAAKAGYFAKFPVYALGKLAYNSCGYVALALAALYEARVLLG